MISIITVARLPFTVNDKGITSGSIVLPNDTAAGNIEVNNRVSSAYNAIVKTLNDAGKLVCTETGQVLETCCCK